MTLFDEEIARLDVERADLAARAARETNDGRRAYVAAIVARVARARATLAAAAAADSGVEKPTTTGRDVARVHARDLTPRRFRLEYVATDTPVVIEGLGSALTEDGADGETCAWLTRRAGNKKVAVTRKDGHRRATLSCEVTDVLDLKDFFAEVVDDRGAGSYLYDTSIPLKLPSLSESVRVPAYVAHDYMQRTMRLTAFSRSWPSLFVAAKNTRSSLHVDQWQGHFFMAMVRGTKRWTVFSRESLAFLRPSWSRGTLDPAMPPLEEQEEMGMLPLPREFGARRWDVDLGPGEVLFVPGGSPHAVRNLDCTVAFAGNFVDDVNLDRVLEDLKLMAAKDPALMESYRALDEVDFDDEGAALAAGDDDVHAGAFDANARVVRVADYLAGGRFV